MGYCIDSIYPGQASCIHNAATGREGKLSHEIARSDQPGKKVIVIGAGPGGLEAARVAAERGHKVKVFEAGPKAGGQVLITAALKRRKEIIGIIDWRLKECERLGVEIEYNRYVDESDVLAEQADIVIVATGGLPNFDSVDEGQDLATSTWDVMTGSVPVAKSVLLYDDTGGHTAMTAAEYMLEAGVSLELVTPMRILAPEVGGTNFPVYFKALKKGNAVITMNTRIERLERRGNQIAAVFLDDYSKEWTERLVDQVVIENGVTPVDDLYFALKPHSKNLGAVDYKAFIAVEPQGKVKKPDATFQLFRIGDAVASRNIHAAIYDAHRLMEAM
jgi:N-methyl-L-proline demethylase